MATLLKDATLRSDTHTISLIGLAHGTSHFFHLMLPPLFPWLMRDFSLSFTKAGALMTVFFVLSGIGQALAGFAVDRYGARRVLFAGMALLGVSGIVLGLAHSYTMLIAAAAIAGMGNSVFHPSDFTILNHRVSQPRLGHAFSAHGLSGNLGWAAAPIFMAGIAVAFDWHVAGFAASAIAFGVLGLLWSQRRQLDFPSARSARKDVPPDSRAARTSPVAFLGIGAVWLCFGFFFLTTMAFGALQNFAPAIMGGVFGLSTAAAASALTAYLVGGAAGILVGGFITARGEAYDRVITLALGAAALIALLIASGALPAWMVVGMMAAMGFGTGLAGPSRDLLVRRAAMASLGPAAYGRVYGFVYSGLDIGLAMAPLAFGPLMDSGHLQEVLLGVAVLQGLAILTAVTVGVRSRALKPGSAAT